MVLKPVGSVLTSPHVCRRFRDDGRKRVQRQLVLVAKAEALHLVGVRNGGVVFDNGRFQQAAHVDSDVARAIAEPEVFGGD